MESTTPIRSLLERYLAIDTKTANVGLSKILQSQRYKDKLSPSTSLRLTGAPKGPSTGAL